LLLPTAADCLEHTLGAADVQHARLTGIHRQTVDRKLREARVHRRPCGAGIDALEDTAALRARVERRGIRRVDCYVPGAAHAASGQSDVARAEGRPTINA